MPSQGSLPDKSDCVDATEARLVGCQAKSEMTKDYFLKVQSWNTAGSWSDDVLSLLGTEMRSVALQEWPRQAAGWTRLSAGQFEGVVYQSKDMYRSVGLFYSGGQFSLRRKLGLNRAFNIPTIDLCGTLYWVGE